MKSRLTLFVCTWALLGANVSLLAQKQHEQDQKEQHQKEQEQSLAAEQFDACIKEDL